jgi:hypothetical protein
MPARDRPTAPKPVSPTPADVAVWEDWINRLKEVARATGVFQTMLSVPGEGGVAHALRKLIKALDKLDGFEEACPLDVQPDIHQGATKIRKLTSRLVRRWHWQRVLEPDGESVVQQVLKDSSATISGVRPEVSSEEFLLLGAACDGINRAIAKLNLLVQQATPPLEQIAKAKQIFHPRPPSPEQAADLRRTFGAGDTPEAPGPAKKDMGEGRRRGQSLTEAEQQRRERILAVENSLNLPKFVGDGTAKIIAACKKREDIDTSAEELARIHKWAAERRRRLGRKPRSRSR